MRSSKAAQMTSVCGQWLAKITPLLHWRISTGAVATAQLQLQLQPQDRDGDASGEEHTRPLAMNFARLTPSCH